MSGLSKTRPKISSRACFCANAALWAALKQNGYRHRGAPSQAHNHQKGERGVRLRMFNKQDKTKSGHTSAHREVESAIMEKL